MFSVIYTFKVKDQMEEQFVSAWKDYTNIIYRNEGSLGSRLHKQGDHEYVAYAQWPDRKTWENAGGHMPESSVEVGKKMKDSCDDIKTLFELDVVEDLLEHQKF